MLNVRESCLFVKWSVFFLISSIMRNVCHTSCYYRNEERVNIKPRFESRPEPRSDLVL